MLLQQRFAPIVALAQRYLGSKVRTHRGLAVRETALECGNDDIFVLLLNDLRCGREYPEGVLALVCIL